MVCKELPQQVVGFIRFFLSWCSALVSNLNDGHKSPPFFSGARLFQLAQPLYNLVCKYKRDGILLYDLHIASYFSQSGADGSCPLIRACFSEDVDSGDLLIPKHGRYGVPVKVITKGKSKRGKVERLTLDESSHEMLWRKSEEAIGTTFLSKL